jgi:hypothetical protein
MTAFPVKSKICSGLLFFITAALLAEGLLLGCGIKGDPVPPRRFRPATVTDLSYSLDGNNLILTWTIPPESAKMKARTAGCKVFRSMRPLDDTQCKNCPVPFENIADIPVARDSSGNYLQKKLIYTETLVGGFDYTFKVFCYTDQDMAADDSNVVNLQY